MNDRSWLRKSLLVALTAVAVSLPATATETWAEEPASQFLEKLRENGYFDLANEYLKRMEKSPLAPIEFRETILFEQALILMAISRSETDFDARQTRLDEAQNKFEEFLVAKKNHDYAPKAKSELANVIVERARVKVAEANRDKNANRKPQLLNEAQQFFEEALEKFKESEEEIRRKLESLPKALDPDRDAKRIEFRDELRADYVKVQMVQAVILHEMADATSDKKQKDELLQRAADAYGEIYKKYRRRLAGLYARLHQGRCYQEMGGNKNIIEALSYYQDLLDQPDEPQPFRVLRTKTLVQALQCWLDESHEEKPLDTALEKSSEWALQIRPNEYSDEDWLKLYYEVARAYKLKIDTLNEKSPERGRYLKEARRLVDHGLKYAEGDLQSEFSKLKADLGGKIEPEAKPDPKTFVDAYQAGRDAMTVLQQQKAMMNILTKRLESTDDPDAKKEIQAKTAETKEAMIDTRSDAIDYLRRALAMADKETSIDDVNNVRYYLCYLYYSQEDYYEAGTLGEFMARYFPGHPGAKNCATVARASFLNLYNAAPEDDRDFETERVIDVCNTIYDKWEGDQEAEDALITLIKFMVQPKTIGNTRMVPPENLAKAKEYLSKIDADSDRRGEAELTAGQAMWSSYLKGLSQWRKWNDQEEPAPAGVDLAARKQELDALKLEAQQTLKNGIERMKESGIDKTLATAVVSLCQIYVDAEQAQDAIALLEDPEIGALTLVKNNHEAVQREGLAEETYKTALRAYIGALPGASDKAAYIAKAEGVMDAMNERVGGDEAGKQKLVSIYVSLAKDVELQIERASAANKDALTQGFATFLDKVGKTATEFSVMNWVAENFYALGEASNTGRGEVPEDAKRYYAEAAEQYQALIDKAPSAQDISPEMVIQLRLRLANVLRRQGKFVQSMDQFEEVLKDKDRNSMLNVQVDAAETYMEWAASEIGVPKLYLVAIRGGRKNASGQYNIWGWSAIARRLGGQLAKHGETMDKTTKDKFTDTMHQALRQKAQSYYEYALTQDDPDRRKKFLGYAKDDIRITARRYPDMGGATQKKEYDQLLRDVQGALQEEVVGLEAFETTQVAAADTGSDVDDGEPSETGSDSSGSEGG